MLENATITVRMATIDLATLDDGLIHVLVAAQVQDEHGETADMSLRVPVHASLDSTLAQIRDEATRYLKALLPLVELQ